MDSEVKKIKSVLQRREMSCREIITEKLSQLRKSPYNTANFLLDDLALDLAGRVDKRIEKGEPLRPLEGVPFGIKDVFMLQGANASGSSEILREYKSPYTATAILKLTDAGAIPIVKENCDCFGHGSSSENTAFGPVKNAYDQQLVSGGSSGGSAVDVAKGFTLFSIGGDSGGSIRQPSGYNRVFGLKPTYGRISRYGIMAYSSSTDCVGPISRSLEDTCLLLNLMSGKDYRDQTTIDTVPVSDLFLKEKSEGKEFRVGYYRNFIDNEGLDENIRRDFLNLVDVLRRSGAEVAELDFYDTNVLVSAYYILAMAETASNLARLDGTVYGKRAAAGANLKDEYALTRSVNFTEETKSRIVAGTQVLSHGYAEGIYQRAQSIRTRVKESFASDFSNNDIIISPVTPGYPPKIGESLANPLEMYLSDAYTVGFSLGGVPTLSAPFATATGVQISAARTREDLIFKFAKYLKDIL